MTVLIVVGIILLLLLLLLFMPIVLQISYKDEFAVTARYLFLKFSLPVAEEDTEEPEEAPEETEKEEGLLQRLKDVFKAHGLKGFLNLLGDIAGLVFNTAKGVLRRVKIKECNLSMIIAGEDAAETALQYGRACAVVYPAFSLIFEYIPCKKQNVAVKVDFQKEKTEINFTVRLHIKLLFLVNENVKAFVKLLPLLKKIKGNGSGKTTKTKKRAAQPAPQTMTGKEEN